MKALEKFMKRWYSCRNKVNAYDIAGAVSEMGVYYEAHPDEFADAMDGAQIALGLYRKHVAAADDKEG